MSTADRPPRLTDLLARARARRTSGGPRRGPTMTAGEVVLAATVGLVLAVFLNAGALVEDAERQPFGAGRDRSLAVWRPIEDIASILQFTRVRDGLDTALGRADDPGGTVVASPEPESAPPDTAAAPTTTTTPAPRLLRRPTAVEPLAAYVAGDSLMHDLGTALVRQAEATTLYSAELDYRISTGLTRPDYFDWPAHLRTKLVELRPEVVVVTFGANDAQGIETPGGAVYQMDDGPPWDAEYRRRVAEVMDLLDGEGRRAYWIGQPPMREPDFARRMERLNAIYRAEAELHPGVTYVDPAPILGDGAGRFQDLVEIEGEIRDLRQGDGIHLALDGASMMADAVLAAIGEDISPTADPQLPAAPPSTGPLTAEPGR